MSCLRFEKLHKLDIGGTAQNTPISIFYVTEALCGRLWLLEFT